MARLKSDVGGAVMPQELKVEDLIATGEDGNRHINHDLLEEFGLFNLPKSTMRSALMIYYENAQQRDANDAKVILVFIRLSVAISRFPRRIAINFMRGKAYHHNMNFMSRYAK